MEFFFYFISELGSAEYRRVNGKTGVTSDENIHRISGWQSG